MNAPTVVGATEQYVRVIIRRPHAYAFLNEAFLEAGGIATATSAGGVAADGTELPLPGLYVLDSEGTVIATTAIGSVEEVLEMLNEPEAGDASASGPEPAALQSASIRVSGFTAAEGIT